MKTMWLWVPEDKDRYGRPRVIAVGSKPPASGKVYEVKAKSADAARVAYYISLQDEPDIEENELEWAKWRSFAKRVKEIG